MLIVGLMSGTSADGIDAALVRIDGDSSNPTIKVEAFQTAPWSPDIRAAILALSAGSGSPRDLSEMRVRLAEGFAAATNSLLDFAGIAPSQVAVIGCHGQTVRHDPPATGARGFTLQLLDPATLAELTGIPVVDDFRAADMAAGGEGAPLVAWPDAVLFGHPTNRRAVLNLGGIANVSLLSPASNGGPAVTGLAFDVGPANVLMDVAIERATAGAETHDASGLRAGKGTVDEALLEELLADPFFRQAPPRSTGREHFGPELVDRLIADRGLIAGEQPAGWDDLLATFAELTVRAIGQAFDEHLTPSGVDEVLVAGGGVHNAHLMTRIAKVLAPLPVVAARDQLGLDPDAREAVAFALLGWAFLNGVPGNVPGATGARGARVLGSWTPSTARAASATVWTQDSDFEGLPFVEYRARKSAK